MMRSNKIISSILEIFFWTKIICWINFMVDLIFIFIFAFLIIKLNPNFKVLWTKDIVFFIFGVTIFSLWKIFIIILGIYNLIIIKQNQDLLNYKYYSISFILLFGGCLFVSIIITNYFVRKVKLQYE
jgi:hypothetical protein